MPKWLRWVILVVALAVFFYSAWKLISIRRRYAVSRAVYSEAAEMFTEHAAEQSDRATDLPGQTQEITSSSGETVTAPITVDFDALCSANPDIIGWIYCENTPINYPVVLGRSNNEYIHTNSLGEYDPGGSIFADAANNGRFLDYNTILYGHHMLDHSMFASLEDWMDQEYFDEHPVMWLLTPEQDYRIDLFSGYVTSADSATYTIYQGPRAEFDQYLEESLAKSQFLSPVVPKGTDHCILLSTCAYVFSQARTVLHGVLTPVDSAGGRPLSQGA